MTFIVLRVSTFGKVTMSNFGRENVFKLLFQEADSVENIGEQWPQRRSRL